jgi:hypothetical protein
MALMRSKVVVLAAGGVMVLGSAVCVPTAASAAEVDRETAGRCSDTSRWELDLEKGQGRIEVDVEVDSRQAGERWSVSLRHNDKRFYKGVRVTDSDGEWDVDRVVTNRQGRDKLSFTATSSRGEKCGGSLKI